MFNGAKLKWFINSCIRFLRSLRGERSMGLANKKKELFLSPKNSSQKMFPIQKVFQKFLLLPNFKVLFLILKFCSNFEVLFQILKVLFPILNFFPRFRSFLPYYVRSGMGWIRIIFCVFCMGGSMAMHRKV